MVTRGIAVYWQQLAGRWACPGWDKTAYATPADAMAAGNTYGQKIRTIYNQICAVSVTDADVDKYFPVVSEEPTEPEIEEKDSTENKPIVDKDDTEAEHVVQEPIGKTDDEKATDLATLIFNVLKKLILMIANLFNKGE